MPKPYPSFTKSEIDYLNQLDAWNVPMEKRLTKLAMWNITRGMAERRGHSL